MAEWWRSWHGAARDQKIALAARKAGVPRAVAVAVWWDLLDIASQADPRGDVSGADPEVIAFALDVDEEDVRAVLSAFEQKGMIGAGRILAWEKRQPKSEDSTAADRKRRQREREKTVTSEGVTECHAQSRRDERDHRDGHIEQSREEQNREEKLASRASGADVVRIGLAFLEAVGADPSPWKSGTKHFGALNQWLADYTEAEILAVASRRADVLRRSRDPLAYATKLMAEEVQAVRAEQNFAADAINRDRDQWLARVKSLTTKGFWAPSWGPKPGADGCQVPAAILAQVEAMGRATE